MFAIDGVKLPSNASKRRSGTRADFERQAAKCEAAAEAMVARHRAEDARDVEPAAGRRKPTRGVARARARCRRSSGRGSRRTRTERRGSTGGVRQSNRTDNESAKLATGKGVVQGYTGVAAVDSAHQIIVDAQAHGTGAEQELLLPVVDALAPLRTAKTLLTADAGYHSEANLAHWRRRAVDALIADLAMRQRDARFATQDRAPCEAGSAARQVGTSRPTPQRLPAERLHLRRRRAHLRVSRRPVALPRRARTW